MEIIINKEETSKLGNEIVDNAIEFDANIKKFNMLIDSINNAWEGADSLKYVNTMKEKYSIGLEELKEFIKLYGTYLKSVPNAYGILDEIFSSKSIDV